MTVQCPPDIRYSPVSHFSEKRGYDFAPEKNESKKPRSDPAPRVYGALKMQDRKMKDWKMTDHIAGVENDWPGKWRTYCMWSGIWGTKKCRTWNIKDRIRIFSRRRITTTSAWTFHVHALVVVPCPLRCRHTHAAQNVLCCVCVTTSLLASVATAQFADRDWRPATAQLHFTVSSSYNSAIVRAVISLQRVLHMDINAFLTV